jgi:glycosyltransferase involved in cell wall biosynthesis
VTVQQKTMQELKNDVNVSIIIPARDEQEHLGALLASLAMLNFPREQLEIIVVDHESRDRTADIALHAGARVFKKTGGTVSGARNLGATKATGKILAFLDADCTVAEDWLDLALPYFTEQSVGIVGSYYTIPGDPSSWLRDVLRKQTEARPKKSEGKWVPAGNMLIRREVFWEFDGFDELLTTCEDVDLCSRVAQKYRVLEDTAIRCLHHGEPRTLWQLFRKELWRGRDNFLGVLRHGLQWGEIPSLVLPIYSVVSLAAFLLSLIIAALRFSDTLPAILLAAILFLLPLLAVASLTALRSGHSRYILHFTVLYAVYFLARGIAPFYRWRYV